MSREQFDALIDKVSEGFVYVRGENDCSDFVKRLAEKAPDYGINVIVRVFDTDRGRHAAVEYRDEDGTDWIGDVIYRKPVRKDLYKRRLNTVGLI